MKLFVERKVINSQEIHDHFRDQGIINLIDPSLYHVTVAYSKTDVSLNNMEFDKNPLTIEPSGVNFTAIFGEYFVQLVLSNLVLFNRFNYFKDQGCSFDWPNYRPHISISENFVGSIDDIRPFEKDIYLGPETWSELKENFSYKIGS